MYLPSVFQLFASASKEPILLLKLVMIALSLVEVVILILMAILALLPVLGNTARGPLHKVRGYPLTDGQPEIGLLNEVFA